jgi:predicted dienelactone hydrolase
MMVVAGATSTSMSAAEIEKSCSQPGVTDLVCYDPPEFPSLTKQALALAHSDPDYAKKLGESAESHRDARIRAVFAIAPVNLHIVPRSLENIAIPVEVVVGAGDPLVPAPAHGAYLARHIPGAKITIYPGAVAHYTFLDTCTPIGIRQRPELCADKPGVDRTAVHAKTASQAVNFFSKSLVP